MDFRECVLHCTQDVSVIETFNRLHGSALSGAVLERLCVSEALSREAMPAGERALLACFIMYVYAHVWRKLKLSHARVAQWSGGGVDAPPQTVQASCLADLMERAAAGPPVPSDGLQPPRPADV
jgi:hypothetical protein